MTLRSYVRGWRWNGHRIEGPGNSRGTETSALGETQFELRPKSPPFLAGIGRRGHRQRMTSAQASDDAGMVALPD